METSSFVFEASKEKWTGGFAPTPTKRQLYLNNAEEPNCLLLKCCLVFFNALRCCCFYSHNAAKLPDRIAYSDQGLHKETFGERFLFVFLNWQVCFRNPMFGPLKRNAYWANLSETFDNVSECFGDHSFLCSSYI